MAALLSPVVGVWLDRGAIKKVMALGAAMMGLAFVIASSITALWQFYIVFGLLMGVGVCLLGGLPSSTLIANWFVERRGAALGIATIGVSLSGVLMPPIGTALIAEFGWRSTFLLYAAVAWIVVVPAILRWVVTRPEDVGRTPYGVVLVDNATSRAPPTPTPRELLGSRNFWIIAMVIALNFCTMGAVLTHSVPHATDLGFSAADAAWVLSTMAICGAIGKPVFGAITDRVDKRIACLAATLLQLGGVGLLLDAHGYGALLVAGGVFGLGMGGVVPLHGALIGAAFGRQAFGRVMGMMSPVMMPVSMVGVPFAGYVFDTQGSYQLAFQILMGAYVLAMGLLTQLRIPDVEPGTELSLPGVLAAE
jgi:MFS family permease